MHERLNMILQMWEVQGPIHQVFLKLQISAEIIYMPNTRYIRQCLAVYSIPRWRRARGKQCYMRQAALLFGVCERTHACKRQQFCAADREADYPGGNASLACDGWRFPFAQCLFCRKHRWALSSEREIDDVSSAIRLPQTSNASHCCLN